MVIARCLLCALLLGASGVTPAQAPQPSAASQQQSLTEAPFEVGEDRLVSAEGPRLPLVEPHLAVNPKDPNNMVAGAMVSKPDGTYGAVAFSTFDGGRTWKSHEFKIGDGGDVWVAFLPDGAAVFSTLAGERSELQVFRSADGGRNWPSKPTSLGFGHDHPTLVVDRLSKQFAGSLYAVSALRRRGSTGQPRSSVNVARSADGGATFPEPAHVIASNLRYEAHNPAVMADGTLLVPFADYRASNTRRRLERPRDWLVTSSDGGKTFSEPLFISETCSGAGGWSSLAADNSGSQFRDRIYHVCPSPQFDGIQVRHSNDRGETWSDPVRVDRPGNVTPYARTPVISVNGQGVVGVAWYDGRNDPNTVKGNFRCHEIYFAASLDGGKTFLPEVKISAQKSCPAEPANLAAALRFPAGGEYMGLDAAPDGTFQLLWADARSGVYQLRAAAVRVRAAR